MKTSTDTRSRGWDFRSAFLFKFKRSLIKGETIRELKHVGRQYNGNQYNESMKTCK